MKAALRCSISKLKIYLIKYLLQYYTIQINLDNYNTNITLFFFRSKSFPTNWRWVSLAKDSASCTVKHQGRRGHANVFHSSISAQKICIFCKYFLLICRGHTKGLNCWEQCTKTAHSGSVVNAVGVDFVQAAIELGILQNCLLGAKMCAIHLHFIWVMWLSAILVQFLPRSRNGFR